MATTYCGVFCKACRVFLVLDQFDEGAARDLVIGPDQELHCKTCGKKCLYSSYDVKFSSSPDGSNPRDRASMT